MRNATQAHLKKRRIRDLGKQELKISRDRGDFRTDEQILEDIKLRMTGDTSRWFRCIKHLRTKRALSREGYLHCVESGCDERVYEVPSHKLT